MTLSTLPTVTVEVAFATAPGSTPTWTDVSDYVRGFTTSRGRQHELARVEAGTARVLLDNRDQRFDPNNTSGAYYPNVLPMRRLRIRATWNAVTYDIFHGFVESWPQSYPGMTDAVVAVEAVDGFKVLNLTTVTASYSAEASGTRIGNVLDSAGWPAADRDIDTGQTTVQAATLTAQAPLDHLLSVADTEYGLFFIGADGAATFIDRHAGYAIALDTANDVYGDGAGEKPYQDVVIRYDDSFLWNQIVATAVGGATSTQNGTASQTSYYKRTLTKSGLLHNSSSEVADYASYLLEAFEEPHLRVERVTIKGAKNPSSLWPRLLLHDIGAKVRVKRNPPGSGSTITQDSFVEGISWTATPGDMTLTWNLAPITALYDYWVLGDTLFSILGDTTRLTY